MKLKLILVTFLISFVSANEITLEWLDSKPRTYARDFYILQYLQQPNITTKEAEDALGLVHRMNNSLLFAYINRINHDESTAIMQCMKMKPEHLVHSYADCIKVGLTVKKALKLDSIQLDDVITKIKKPYPNYAKVLRIVNSPIVFSKLLASDVDTFYTIFLKSTRDFRINKLNYRLSKRAINKIKNDKRFSKLLTYIITNPKMNLAQKSFFDIDDTQLSSEDSFMLAINLITHNKEKEALKYLNNAYNKAYFQANKDKVLFWKYQISKDNQYMNSLLESEDINIYSLYAKEKHKKSFQNIIYDIKQSEKNTNYDIEDQFFWIDVIRDTKELNEETIQKYETVFSSALTKPHLTFLYAKYNKHKKHYFINPYKEIIQNYPKQRQVLINAIARQESSFIPSSISTAYAQGVMQIMPFLSKHIAHNLKEAYHIDNMFKPSYSIKYANHHLEALQKRFKHPLFIAYAYNGGGGFTSSIIKNGLFSNGKYEPYLSMEKVPYSETRNYGKKVLANYLVYTEKINKKKISLTTLLEKLPKPSELAL